MDNDLPGTAYCIGFSKCVTRTIELTHALRTTAGSHEHFLFIEVFGRQAGYTALLPPIAGAADRCVILEAPFDMDDLTELLVYDRKRTSCGWRLDFDAHAERDVARRHLSAPMER